MKSLVGNTQVTVHGIKDYLRVVDSSGNVTPTTAECQKNLL